MGVLPTDLSMERPLWPTGRQQGEQKALGPGHPRHALTKSYFRRSGVSREERAGLCLRPWKMKVLALCPGWPKLSHGSHTTMSSRVPTMCACAQAWGVQDTPGLEEEGEDQS